MPFSSSIYPIDPTSFFNEGFELSDQSIIPSKNFTGSFVPEINNVEFYVYDTNKSLLSTNYDFINWSITQNSDTTELTSTDTIGLDPVNDVFNEGFANGTLYAVYNFINKELSSSFDNSYYVSEISSDRTEIRIKSNFITNEEIETSFNDLKQRLETAEYFDEIYVSFFNNEYNIGTNIELDSTSEQYSILIKLYNSLPPQYEVKNELYVVTKVGESQAFQVNFIEELVDFNDVTYLKGPNTNLELKDFINNSTELQSKEDLLKTNSSESRFNLQNILDRKGVKITPNYSYNNFGEFVNFSSAEKRIKNFVDKVEQIQSYETDLVTLSVITGSTSESFQVSSSIASAYSNIENIIKNFDGYEYYLYYDTSSLSYPKTGSSFPYTLYDYDSTETLTWLGNSEETSSYYGGILLSASLFDKNNQNWLYYTIPDFIKSDSDNDNYIEFSNMVGQHFDEIWLYTKAVSQKLDTTNELDKGIPLEIAEEAITSLGYEGFGNNYNNQDNFIGLVGEDNRDYLPKTGSDLITQYIAVNGPRIANYWTPPYSYPYYVYSLNEPGWPYAIDRVSKEIFKRLYHNMVYLVKKKGTISGLRQLINIWGIPNTILRINEFGGKNKDNVDDYDLWYNRYSYAFHAAPYQNVASASVRFPWMPLERNRITDGEYIVPDGFQFRFKTTGYPSSSYVGEFFTQSLAVKKSDGDGDSPHVDFGIYLYYTGSTSGSYSGSSTSEYNDWGIMKFFISGSSGNGGIAESNEIYLPFFNNGWWSVMLQRDQHISASDHNDATTYTLYTKNKYYDGYDGNSIGFEGSASIVSNVSFSVNQSWNAFGTESVDGLYLGGFISGSTMGIKTYSEAGRTFSGSLQEFRYYAYAISESIFDDYVMNPESIEGINITGSLSSFDILNFRAPLGNELESVFQAPFSSSCTESLTSFHPAVTCSADSLMTASFVDPNGDVTSSEYDVIYYENSNIKTFSEPNREIYFLDQPAMGLRNRISNKIQIINSSSYDNTLSDKISIQQNYQISKSYTEDINSLEVAFSPQDEVDDDIIQTYGYGVIADSLADPRFISSSDDHYPQLRRVAEDYFKKYTKGNIHDYIRLIKYFDNSIFKAIKNYVPARTSVTTGIIIKQHLLERNRYRAPQINHNTTVALTPSGSYNTPLTLQDLELTTSINIGTITGSTGGSLNKFNYSGSPSFQQTPITQSWLNTFDTISGSQTIIENTQKEFYNGVFSGSEPKVTTQSLNPNNSYKASDSVFKDNSSYYFEVKGYLWFVTPLFNKNDDTLVYIYRDYTDGNYISASFVDYVSLGPQYGKFVINNLEGGVFPLSQSDEWGVNTRILADTTQNTMFSLHDWEYFGIDFTYNDNNAIINNYNDNRPNSYIMEVDYSTDSKDAINRLAIISGSATKAQTPDSNYTMERIIAPRYDGSKLYSANYNFYTPSSSVGPTLGTASDNPMLTFLNGDTGSWSGDESYGKTAVIDKNPIYFAHFKSSKESREVWDTYTFRVDSLIEAPRENIQGQAVEPITVKIEGNNDKIFEVARTFEKGRKATVNYTTDNYNNVDYSSINITNNKIFQGSLEYQLIGGTEYDKTNAVTTSSFITCSWVIGLDQYFNSSKIVTFDTSSNFGKNYWMETGSNSLTLMGGVLQMSSSLNTDFQYLMKGPGLGLIHSINYALKNNLTASYIGSYATFTGSLGIPQIGTFDSNDKNNYWLFNPSSSGLSVYEDSFIPFLLENGDEIRVTYNTISGSALPIYQSVDFSVLNIASLNNSFFGLNSLNQDYSITVANFPSIFWSSRAVASSIFSKLIVTPDPSELSIPDGKITNFTIRRRNEKDDRVIIYQFPPTGSQGFLTPSGEGYLIPDDMTETQKRNVLTIINQLKAKNAFRDDESTI